MTIQTETINKLGGLIRKISEKRDITNEDLVTFKSIQKDYYAIQATECKVSSDDNIAVQSLYAAIKHLKTPGLFTPPVIRLPDGGAFISTSDMCKWFRSEARALNADLIQVLQKALDEIKSFESVSIEAAAPVIRPQSPCS